MTYRIVQYQGGAAFTPQGTIVSVFRDGWRAALDRAVVPPFKAAEQQWASFQPFLQLLPGLGWSGGQADITLGRVIIDSMATPIVPPTQVQNTATMSWAEATPRMALPFPVTEQKFADAPTPQVVVSVFPEGWRGIQLDANKIPPFPIAEQKFDPWTAQPPYNTVLTAWAELTPRFTPRFPVAEQRWDAWPAIPPYNTVLTAWQETTPRFAKPFPANEQRWDSWPTIPPYNTIISAGWVDQDYKFATPFPAASQRWDAFEPQGSITSVFPEGWRGLQLEAKLAKPFPITGQQFIAPFMATSAVITFVDGWRGFQLDAQAKAPFGAAQQQWAAFSPAGKITSVFPEGWRGLQLDARLAQQFPIGAQQFGGLIPPPSVVYPDGWRGLQLDAKLARPFPASAQRWDAFEPAGAITSVFPEGWRGLTFEAKAQPFPVTAQAFTANVTPQKIAVVIFTEGWRGVQLDTQILDVTKLKVTEQQWTGFTPFQNLLAGFGWSGGQADITRRFLVLETGNLLQQHEISVYPDGWRGFQLERRHVFPQMRVTDQQFYNYPPRGTIISVYPLGWWGIKLETQFAKPFPVIAQQWASWTAQDVPLFFPPGSGDYPKYPSWVPQPPYEERPRKKPVWPIWDRKRWEEEQRRKGVIPVTPLPVLPPPQSIYGPPRIVTPQGLPTFREYAPQDPASLARQMQEAQDLGEASSAVHALQEAQAQQQEQDEQDMLDALAALKALGLIK